MVTVEELIGKLLLRHNCVIIPAFGGFVAKKVSAKIDFSSGKMYPPRKSLLFNKQLINNDGLLINELAQSNNISYDNASNEIQSKVGEWNRLIKEGKRIEIDKVGYIFADREQNICFEQDRFFNLLLESFGLGKIQFIPEHEVTATETQSVHPQSETPIISLNPVEVVEEKISEQEEEIHVAEVSARVGGRKKIWKYVAAACILPIAFYSIWIPMKTDVLESGVLSIYDFNPFRVQSEAKYEGPSSIENETVLALEEETPLEQKIKSLPSDVSVYTYKYDDELFIPVALSDNTELNLKEGNNETTVPVVVHNANFEPNSMHYIVGCFGVKTNATNFVAKLRAEGLDARIVDVKNGLHRVAAGSSISMEGLNKIKAEVTALGHSGWTLK